MVNAELIVIAMNYSESFKHLVFDNNSSNFLGWGNPNAKILILGKEPAIDTSTEYGQSQYEIEVVHNKQDWRENIINQTDYEDVFSVCHRQYGNPLFPHCWQKYQVKNRRAGILPNGDGTSRTWYQSQKLIDMITCREFTRNGYLDFHKYCFSTDLSAKAALNNSLTNKEETIKSIQERQSLFTSDFFKGFPVVIAAIGNYRNYFDWNNYVSKTFAVDSSPSGIIHINRANFTIHECHDNTHRLIITCYQLSARISNEYLNAIADTVKQFIDRVSSEK